MCLLNEQGYTICGYWLLLLANVETKKLKVHLLF